MSTARALDAKTMTTMMVARGNDVASFQLARCQRHDADDSHALLTGWA